jgi:hypothetical protein
MFVGLVGSEVYLGFSSVRLPSNNGSVFEYFKEVSGFVETGWVFSSSLTGFTSDFYPTEVAKS